MNPGTQSSHCTYTGEKEGSPEHRCEDEREVPTPQHWALFTAHLPIYLANQFTPGSNNK